MSPPLAQPGYRELPPAADLANAVECFWADDSELVPGTQVRVLPDGCVDILCDLNRGTANVVGTMTTALVLPPAKMNVLAVRFRPGMAGHFLGETLDAFTDQAIPLEELWRGGARLGEEIAERTERDHHAAVDALQNQLRARRKELHQTRNLHAAVTRMIADWESSSVAGLAAAAGVSRQQLTREFTRRVGIGPKKFQRVMRLQRLVAAVKLRLRQPGHQGQGRPAPSISWAALAAEFGYYDQAHLVNEFRDLSGLTPAAYFAR